MGMKKSGCGNQSNSSSWSVAYNTKYDKYVASLSLCSAYGCWQSMYEIPKTTFEKAGSFEDDDYKTENLIRKGKLLYEYDNERNYPEPVEIIQDRNYQELCEVLFEDDGKP